MENTPSSPSDNSQGTETQEAVAEATTVNDNGEAQSETTYLDGKYKSVSALEDGYKELQSTFSKKTQEYNENITKYAVTTAPEAYELAEGIEKTPRIEALEAWGKENNLSNDALNAIISNDQKATEDAKVAYIAEQKEALGADADTRIKNVVDWSRANLGEDSIGTLEAMITSAKGVEMFEKIAKINSGTAPSQAPAQPRADAETIKAMRFAKDEFGNRKMSSNPAYRAKVEAMEAELYSSH